MRGLLLSTGLITESDDELLHEQIKLEVDQAVDWAESQPRPDPDTLEDGVFA